MSVYKPPRMFLLLKLTGDSHQTVSVIADNVYFALHRGSPTCMTRSSPLTSHRNKSTTPAPNRLSEVSHLNVVHLLFKVQKGYKYQKNKTADLKIASPAHSWSLCWLCQ